MCNDSSAPSPTPAPKKRINKKKAITGTLLLMIILLSSCQSIGGCITIGGEYKDAKGNLTWCLDKQITEKPVITSPNGEKALILMPSDQEKIASLIENKVVTLSKEPTLQKLIRLLK